MTPTDDSARLPRPRVAGRRLLRGAAALVVLAGLLVLPAASAKEEGWTGAIGDPAPALELEDLAGETISLRGLEGKAVLVNLWATYCLPCRHEMPLLDDLASSHREDGLVLLGVSLDGPGMEKRVDALRDELEIGYPILLDPEGEASRLFPAPALPASYLFDREGNLVWKRIGVVVEDDPDLARALERALEPAE